tara:strand:+ start:12476 stop:13252 length:777 start_codon:yes stop_codon:yes gene_type:complete
MPRFSANISMLYTEVPLLERVTLAKRAGFDGIEVQFPYVCSALDFKHALDESGMPLVLFNCPAGDLMTGGQGNAAVPGREDEFKTAIEQAADYARILQPMNINILAGCPNNKLLREDCLSVFVANLQTAMNVLSGLDVQLLTEAINTDDMPDSLLSTSSQVLDVMKNFGNDKLKLQFDVYHIEKMEGNVIEKLQEILPSIGHIQFADVPGRHEPGSGGINFQRIFTLIDQLPYAGFLGAEYLSSGNTNDSLDWLAEWK